MSAAAIPGGRDGMTLIEVVVAVALLGILAALAGVAAPSLPGRITDDPAQRVAAARRRALEEGHPMSVAIPLGGQVLAATAFPDGRVTADTLLRVNLMTGRGDAR